MVSLDSWEKGSDKNGNEVEECEGGATNTIAKYWGLVNRREENRKKAMAADGVLVVADASEVFYFGAKNVAGSKESVVTMTFDPSQNI